MSGDSDEINWLEVSDGQKLGVQPLSRAGQNCVRLLFPNGTEKVIKRESAPEVLAMLMTGISFSDITGSGGFTVSPDDF